ncbi:MAG: hypothetical protein KF878_08855 [Planctomycetes bacterium]|nr:hypothetical protein [Planctomycetota bacterium]
MTPTRRLCLLVVTAAALLGCPDGRPRYATSEEARAAAAAARDEARAARDARDAERALKAATLAEDALRQAEALAGAAPVDSATTPLGEVRRAAREARDLAREADERARLEAQRAGLVARAYRPARAAALGGSFTALAHAARQADAKGLEALPEQVRDAALAAGRWAEEATGRAPRPDGAPDWAGIAADMDALAAAPPRGIGVSLTLGFLALGRPTLALLEADALDPAAAADPLERLALHLLRGLALNGAGYRRLALLEVEAGLDGSGLQGVEVGGLTVSGAQVLGGAHLALAAFHLREEDHAAADRELALALRAWPESPVATYLTGEQLLASGERERAAASLEAAVAGGGEDAEWLAAQLAARARGIRDGTVDADDGLLGDPVFLARLALHALWKAAERSPEAARVRAEADRARALCADLLGRLPRLE